MEMILASLLAITVNSSHIGTAFKFPWIVEKLDDVGSYLNLDEKILTLDSGRACYSILDGWAERQMWLYYNWWSGAMQEADCDALGPFKLGVSRDWENRFGTSDSAMIMSNAVDVIGYVNNNLDVSNFLLPGTGDMPSHDWSYVGSGIQDQTQFHGVLVKTSETGMKVEPNQVISRRAYGTINSILSDVFAAAQPTQAPFSAWASVETSGWPYTLLSNFNLAAYGDSTRTHSTFDGSLKKSAWNRARAVLPMMGDVVKYLPEVSVVSNVMNDTYSHASIKGGWIGAAGPAWDDEAKKYVFIFPSLSKMEVSNAVETVTTNIDVYCSDAAIYDMQNVDWMGSAGFTCYSRGMIGEGFASKRNGLMCVFEGHVYSEERVPVFKFVGYNSREDETMGPIVFEIGEGLYQLNEFQMTRSGEQDIYQPIPITNAVAGASAHFFRNVKYVKPDGGYYDERTLPNPSWQDIYSNSALEYCNLINAEWYDEEGSTPTESPYKDNPLTESIKNETTNAQWRCGHVASLGTQRFVIGSRFLSNALGCSSKLGELFSAVRGGSISQYCQVDISDARAYWNALSASMEDALEEGVDATIQYDDAFFVFDTSAGGPVGLYVKASSEMAYRYVGMNGEVAHSVCSQSIRPEYDPGERGYDNTCWFHGVGTWDQRLRMNMDWKNYKMQSE